MCARALKGLRVQWRGHPRPSTLRPSPLQPLPVCQPTDLSNPRTANCLPRIAQPVVSFPLCVSGTHTSKISCGHTLTSNRYPCYTPAFGQECQQSHSGICTAQVHVCVRTWILHKHTLVCKHTHKIHSSGCKGHCAPQRAFLLETSRFMAGILSHLPMSGP